MGRCLRQTPPQKSDFWQSHSVPVWQSRRACGRRAPGGRRAAGGRANSDPTGVPSPIQDCYPPAGGDHQNDPNQVHMAGLGRYLHEVHPTGLPEPLGLFPAPKMGKTHFSLRPGPPWAVAVGQPLRAGYTGPPQQGDSNFGCGCGWVGVGVNTSGVRVGATARPPPAARRPPPFVSVQHRNTMSHVPKIKNATKWVAMKPF